MGPLIEIIINLVVPLVLLVVAYVVGSRREQKHLASIQRREKSTQTIPTLTFRHAPSGWRVDSSELVMGSVVISLDYFKRFVAGLRGLVGGRVGSYESLLDRARRESLLRMKEDAIKKGYDAIIHVRFETSRLASSAQNGKGTSGVELMAYGTAITFTDEQDAHL